METITSKHFEQPKTEVSGPRVVKFTNFSNEDFTWTLNKIPYTFPAGSVKYFEYAIAKHFAKHLVNRELLKRGRENDTSPKKKEENPYFMELYNKCIGEIPTESGETDQTKLEQEAIDKNMKEKLEKKEMNSEITPPVKPSKYGKPDNKKEKEEEKEFEEIEAPPSDDDAE